MRQLFLFIIFAAFFTACHRDFEPSDTVEIIDTFSPVVYVEINSTITGTVRDQSGNPIQDAIVQIYSASTKTNEAGVFVFKDTRMDQQGTFVRVQKMGYVLTGDIVYPTKTSRVHTDITMSRMTASSAISNNVGGLIELGNGGNLAFKPSAFLDKNGQLYNEKVSISTLYVNPSDTFFYQKLPGGLRGTDSKGNSVVLGFMGAFDVELATANGSEVSIDTTRKMVVKFPATTSYRPLTIPLWHFDKLSGHWQEAGLANLQGDFYVGEVKKTGFWMLGAPFSLVKLSGKMVARNGIAIQNASFEIVAKGLYVGNGVVNSEGEFNIFGPKGEDLKFIALPQNECSLEKVVYLKPLSNDTRMDDIVLDIDTPIYAKGRTLCDGEITKNATLVLKIREKIFIALPNDQGLFSMDYSIFSCESFLDEFSIFGINNSTGKLSGEQYFSINSSNDIVIDVCTTSCAIELNLDVSCDSAAVRVTGGSGNYNYNWKNSIVLAGSSIALSNIDFSTSNLICVTVSDKVNPSCSKQICQESLAPLSFDFEGGCAPSSILSANPWTGAGLTFSYVWSNGASTKDIQISSPTNSICCTITDNRGCSAVGCTIAGYDLNDVSYGSCQGSKYELRTPPFTKFFINDNGNSVQFNPGSVIIDVFQYGFTLNGSINTAQCSSTWELGLPQIADNVLSVTSKVAPSCVGCIDGRISYSLNTTGTCFNCSIGEVSLYRTNNLSTNLINNINGNLAAGKYYLCVNDANNSCIIGYKIVEL